LNPYDGHFATLQAGLSPAKKLTGDYDLYL